MNKNDVEIKTLKENFPSKWVFYSNEATITLSLHPSVIVMNILTHNRDLFENLLHNNWSEFMFWIYDIFDYAVFPYQLIIYIAMPITIDSVQYSSTVSHSGRAQISKHNKLQNFNFSLALRSFAVCWMQICTIEFWKWKFFARFHEIWRLCSRSSFCAFCYVSRTVAIYQFRTLSEPAGYC